jgi:glycosyltransferase involved in cell wall biosynthesis
MALLPAKLDLALQNGWAWLGKRRCLQPLKPPLRLYRRVYAKVRQAVGILVRFVRDPEYRARHSPRFTRTAAVLWNCTLLRFVRGPRARPRPVGPGEKPRIVMLVFSYLPVDPRVEREAKALVASGFEVTVICPEWSPPAPAPDWGPHIQIRVIPSNGVLHCYDQFFPYVYDPRLLQAALEEDAWAYHSHDLNTALPALVAAAKKRVPCVCDFHEWFSENVTFNWTTRVYEPHPKLKRRIFQLLEYVAIHSASKVVTVCESIAELLEKNFRSRQKVEVIRNIPHLNRGNSVTRWFPMDIRAELGLPKETRILLYQGGVGPSRNLEPIVRAMAYVKSAAFVIRGPAIDAFGAGYKKLAEECGCADRVFWLPPVPASDVVLEARAADLGIWTLLSNVGLNFKLALPNKVFEYLAAGVPILVADLPEARKIVDRYQVGLAFDPEDPRAIAAAINRLAEDPDALAVCRANIPLALEDMAADREWQKLVDIYRRFIPAPPRASVPGIRPLPEPAARQAA